MSDPRDPATEPVDRDRNRGAGEADDAALLSESAAVAPSEGRGGRGGSAAGGYGSASDVQSSGGTGEGTDDTSRPGDDAQTDWLRDAPGAAGDR